MALDKRFHVRRPSRLLLWTVCAYFYPFYKIKHKIKIDRSGLKGLKKPYIVLVSHTGWNDYAIVGATLLPHSANFMVTNLIEREPIIRTLTKIMGSIYKRVFYPDSNSIRRARYVLDRKGIIVMMPAGDVSIDGSTNYLDNGTARLIKWLNVPVVALTIHGGYLHLPRFHKKTNAGARIEVETKLLFTPEKIQEKTTKQIYEELWDALYFNDFEWQKQKRMVFKGKNLADGMENILFKCPKCGGEFTNRSHGMRIECEKCGNTVNVNKYFEFEPCDAEDKCFDNIYEWNKFQKESINKEIKDPDFTFTVKTEIWRDKRNSKTGYEKRGEGTLSLDSKNIVYRGTFDGEEVEQIKNIRRLPNISMVNCDCIEVTAGEYVNRYFFADHRQYVKFVLMFNLIRLKYYPYDYRDDAVMQF